MAGNKGNESFFARLFSKLLKSSDPDVEKKRLLKNIAKETNHNKYKFIKTSSLEITPQFGKFFYDIYKAIAPAQSIVRNIQNPNQFKNAVFIMGMSAEQQKIYERLSEENIMQEAAQKPFNEFEESIKQDLQAFTNEFDSDKINKLNDIYRKLEMFKVFCEYDYYFLLKKFDSSIKEASFNVPPRFDNIRGEYIVNEIQDFYDILYSMQLDGDWSGVLKVFKELRGVEPVAIKTWNKVLAILRDVRNSRILEEMLKLILQDPFYTQKVNIETKEFVDEFLDKLKNQTQEALRKVEKQRKDSKVGELATGLFGTAEVIVLKNYTTKLNPVFERKNLSGYTYCQPLNYMKAFLTDIFKKDVREFADLVLIRGKWTTNLLSKQISDVYNAILANCEELNAFDDSLSEEKDRGSKIKILSLRSDKDTEANKIIRTQLRDINEDAFNILTSTSQNLVQFARDIKALLEDKEKTSPQMIINWKELEHFSDTPIREFGIAIYKSIYQFVTLMQVFLKKN